jgi:hypothetical protein
MAGSRGGNQRREWPPEKVRGQGENGERGKSPAVPSDAKKKASLDLAGRG